MYTEYRKEYSYNLGRDMEYKIYGDAGKPCIVFPCQNGRFYDYEDFEMVKLLAPYIEQKRLRLICVDSVDEESWSASHAPLRQRIEKQEQYYRYITEEIVPQIQKITGRNDFIATGCSMGGYHSTNFFFRRPDLFDTLISLSGSLDAAYFLGSYSDELVYNNSPIAFLQNMHADHAYWDMYRNRQIHICIGQGAWEDELIPGNKAMAHILSQHGIYGAVDFWGHDVDHDWPWWRKQIRYFMEKVLGPM